MVFASGGNRVEICLDGFVEILGMDEQLLVGPRGRSDPAVELDGSRKDKAVVVVGVLPDEVYPARRTVDGGSRSETRAKLFLKLNSNSQRSYYFRFALGAGEEFASAEVEKSATPMRIMVSRVVMLSGFSVQMP